MVQDLGFVGYKAVYYVGIICPHCMLATSKIGFLWAF